uniref:Phosphatidylinositol 4-kinase type 2 n=1 Tax=Romanomermis culicivorax TaxID=13658 RepID=A0A915KHQ4_ROMCU
MSSVNAEKQTMVGCQHETDDKIGSMQKFVNGYVSATEFDYDRLVTVAAKRAFRAEFERLVILDYIIRNTDRGSDNWLIKYEDVPNPRYVPSLDTTKSQESADDTALANSNNSKGKGNNQAVVANLSEKSSTAAAQGATSTNPFGWMYLKEAKVPFSDETKQILGPYLRNITFVEQIVESLRQLFKIDSDYKNTIFDKQMTVMRGQILNINNAFKQNFSPYQLARMTPLFMIRDLSQNEPKSRLRWSMYKKAKRKREPWFNR